MQKKFTFSTSIRGIDSLPELCVKSATVNCFKNHISVALEPLCSDVKLSFMIVGYIWHEPVIIYAISVVI